MCLKTGCTPKKTKCYVQGENNDEPWAVEVHIGPRRKICVSVLFLVLWLQHCSMERWKGDDDLDMGHGQLLPQD